LARRRSIGVVVLSIDLVCDRSALGHAIRGRRDLF